MSPAEQSTPSYNTEQPAFRPIIRRPESPQRPPKLPRVEEDHTDDDDDCEEEEEEEEKVEMMNRKEGLQRYLVAVEYMGTRFCGSQQQPNLRTVMGVLQEAFQKFVGQPVSVLCSSRTDTGVHALSNVCHVDAQRISKRKPGEVLEPHEPAVVIKAVNHFLLKERDIAVIDVRNVPFDFHARHKAKERMYYYRLLSGTEPLSIFERDRAWHVQEELDLQRMEEACKVLVGTHDFSSFRGSGCQARSPIRTLDELHIFKSVSAPYIQSFTNVTVNASIDTTAKGTSDGTCQGFGVRREHHCLILKARARSFLYHQVRLMVGVLKCVGTGQITVADVERILNAKDVNAASPMAPACGLYLGHVTYDLN